MGMMVAGLSALQSCDMDAIPAHVAKNIYLGNPKAVDEQIFRVMSSFASITAASYCHFVGKQWNPPKDEFNFIENFLYMTGHVDEKTGKPNPKYVKNFEQLWVLIADHEMTCSTAALLHTASSLPDLISSMISALSALYGPLHGGAIEVAYKNIQEIGCVENIPAKIERVKSGKERLYGYGHRVYRVEDPRYVHIRRILDSLSEETASDEVLQVAFEVDRVASTDEYFTSRKLRPNADLFAAFTYQAMGFPCEFILPLSVLSRMQGFMAHWKEAMCKFYILKSTINIANNFDSWNCPYLASCPAIHWRIESEVLDVYYDRQNISPQGLQELLRACIGNRHTGVEGGFYAAGWAEGRSISIEIDLINGYECFASHILLSVTMSCINECLSLAPAAHACLPC